MGDNPRRINEPAAAHGVHTTPPVTGLRAQSAQLIGHEVIIAIQPDTIALVGTDGSLQTADAMETTIKANGGQPLQLPTAFASAPAPGWTATLNTATDELLIHLPGGHALYDGTMPTTLQWRTSVKAARSVVLITGPFATLNDVEPMILAGRAHWTRIPIRLT
ncbi:hypothetical protein ACIP9H_33470 [Streptomyces sp. NPDC088732]|uniref:hypothetical protein n=1 Tax=Streptomyces sp. NPDC088732 TaxID=3365879 RepID=UPI0038285164